jgi:hypothetical protein
VPRQGLEGAALGARGGARRRSGRCGNEALRTGGKAAAPASGALPPLQPQQQRERHQARAPGGTVELNEICSSLAPVLLGPARCLVELAGRRRGVAGGGRGGAPAVAAALATKPP